MLVYRIEMTTCIKLMKKEISQKKKLEKKTKVRYGVLPFVENCRLAKVLFLFTWAIVKYNQRLS